MSWTWEVSEWWQDNTKGQDYKYHHEWGGESLIKALWIMWKLKRDGAVCLKLEWRPRREKRNENNIHTGRL
jgi:hypothetical protein